MWKSIFILRIWRTWLDENDYAASEHFITSNAYTCTELNGHMLVNTTLRVMQGSLPQESLRVWKAGSQSCEQLFRLVRSMTPTFNTIINFTLKGLLHRIHKLAFLGAMEATGKTEFPRAKRRLLQVQKEPDVTLKAPSSMVIYTQCFAEAKKQAIEECDKLSMTISCYEDKYLLKDKLQLSNLAVAEDQESLFDTEVGYATEINENVQESQAEIRQIHAEEGQSNNISLVRKNALGFLTYIQSGTEIRETLTTKKYIC